MTLSYRIVARWVRASNEGHENAADIAPAGRPSLSDEEVQAVAELQIDVESRRYVS